MAGAVPARAARLIFVAKTARTFCYGFLGIALPLHLSALGADARGVGAMVTLTLASSAGLTWAVRRPAERHGAVGPLLALAALSLAAAAALVPAPALFAAFGAGALAQIVVY